MARVSVTVAVPPELAFELFTRDIDRWWQRGQRYRHAGSAAGVMYLEPRAGGRLFESTDGPAFEIGRVSVWEPPHRLAFSWRNVNYAPAESTQVEIDFVATRSGTLITVTHRGLATLRPDHPARHGLPPADFVRLIGQRWGEQMSALRRHCAPAT